MPLSYSGTIIGWDYIIYSKYQKGPSIDPLNIWTRNAITAQIN